MKPISTEQILNLRKAKQYFSDCYLVSSVHALTKTENGQKFLQQNILTDGRNCNIRFNRVIDKAEDFFVSEETSKKLILVDEYANEIKIDEPHNPIIKAIEIAMSRIITEHPEKKPLICLLAPCIENFEYNKPSNFMEMFTGRKPIILNEDGLRLSLKHNKEEAISLFEQMDKANEFSFVAGTSLFNRQGLSDFHCYTINGVNSANQYIEIIDNRLQKSMQLPFENAIRGFKFLTGYFNSNLK